MTTAIHTEIEEIGRLSARSGYSESMFAFQFAVIHIRRYIEISVRMNKRAIAAAGWIRGHHCGGCLAFLVGWSVDL
jgi:hypothetical protein